jgi:hypothetical protein
MSLKSVATDGNPSGLLDHNSTTGGLAKIHQPAGGGDPERGAGAFDEGGTEGP